MKITKNQLRQIIKEAMQPAMRPKMEQRLQGAPQPVVDVAEAWHANAMAAGEAELKEMGRGVTSGKQAATRNFWRQRLYVEFDDGASRSGRSGGSAYWEVSDNYDRGPIMKYYPDADRWTMTYPFESSETELEGGTQEALANAQIMFTG